MHGQTQIKLVIGNRLLGPQSYSSVVVKKTLFARSKVLTAVLVKTLKSLRCNVVLLGK